jgi:hypothetical protein
VIDQPLGRGASRSARLRDLAASRAAAAPVALVALVGLSVLVRALLAQQIPVPFIFGDELLHAELARSVLEHGTYDVRGHGVTISFTYPLALAPAWLAGSVSTAYTLMKVVNALLMSLAAVPVYLWGRRFLSPFGALLAAALTLLLPGLVLTGTLMTENAFFPAFLLALLAIGVCVERPTPGRQALAVAAIGLAGASRLQGLLLVPVLVAAVVLERVLARRARGAPRAVLALWPAAALLGAAVAVYVIVKAASGAPLTALGVYSGVAPTHYSLGGVLRWMLYALGEIGLTTALVPLAAFGLLLTLTPRNSQERAFLATGASALAALVALAGFAAFWLPHGLKDRYLFPGVPVLFLGLALWVERGLPRPGSRTLVVAAAAFGLVALMPLRTLFGSTALLGNALGLVALDRWAGVVGGIGTLRGIVIGLGVVAAAAFAFAPRRLWPALVAGVAVLLVASSVSLFRAVRAQARGVDALAAIGSKRSWIDSRVGRHADVAYVNATQYEPESASGQYWEQWVPVWESEFWNRSLDRSISLGLREPLPLFQENATLDWPTGRIAGVASPGYAVVDPRFAVVGSRLASGPTLALYSVRPPLRLASTEERVYRDAWAGDRAAFDGWTPAPAVEVTLSRPGWPRGAAAGPVTVASGPLAPQGGGAQLGGETAQQVVDLPAGATRTVRIPVPAPPWRVELTVPNTFVPAQYGFSGDTRDLGARVRFRALPVGS